MEAYIVLGGIGVAASFGCGTLLAASAARGGRRRAPAASGGGSRLAGAAGWRLRNGVGFLMPVARALVGTRRIGTLAREGVEVLRGRGLAVSEEPLISVCVALLAVVGVGVSLVTFSPVCGAAVAACVAAAGLARLHSAQEKRRQELCDAVPDALRSMGVCFQSGLSLMQTLQQVASESRGPLRDLFQRAAHRLEIGEGADEALSTLRQGASVPELAFVAVALDVQHQAGGSLRQVLDAARESVEGEIELRRALKVQTAQAKLSARVVSVMPFVLLAVFSLVSEGFLEPFFASPMGLALLALALGMQAAGVMAVRRMLAVEVA